MAVTSGFFNSINHDRTYNADQFSGLFDGLINDGVYASVGNCFIVKPVSGMTISISSGRAWFNNTWIYNDNGYMLTIKPADVLYGRIDTVALKIDKRNRLCEFVIVNGILSDRPYTAPLLTDETDIFYHPLANINIDPGTTIITENDIDNVIGRDPKTPFVTGILQTSSISDIYNKWRTEFNEWFEHLRDELDDNQAGHLQNEIDLLNEKEFNHYHDLCNSNTTIEVDENNDIIRITSTDINNNITDIIQFNGDNNIVETINVDGTIYTAEINRTSDLTITERYTKGGIT